METERLRSQMSGSVGENAQTAVVVDDFNGDGLADIIIAGQNQNFVA